MSVEPKVMEHVREALESFGDKYIDHGVLKRNAIIEDLDAYNERLMTELLSDDLIHRSYTKKIANVEIFEVNQFINMLEFKDYWEDSYTKYSNKIGLTAGGKFIDESADVVFDFPFKDTVLKAGMSKEDLENKDDADEPFLNEVIAKPEIDELFEPKVLVNAKQYDEYGVHEATNFNDQDNLVIKGNNLIALYSLKRRYAGRVNLIYLDPPFNTGSDSFKYNDRFNESAWLTFMKNRLEVAKDLLTETGNIFIHIDINENHKLKVLADNIFGKSNFVEEIIWSYGSASGGRAAGAKPVNIHDYILHYAKNYPVRKQNKSYTPYSKEYINNWFKYKDEDGRVYQRRQRGKDEQGNPIWHKQYLDESNGVPLTTVWTDIKQVYANPQAYKEANRSSSEIEFDFGNSGQKPEKLLKRILEMSSDPGDVVLDFFGGSGTTAAVSLKLRRKFITVEQIDSQVEIEIKRLSDAINGKNSGISKEVNWQGGGSFVYAELMEKNGGYLRDIRSAETFDELSSVFNRMKGTTDFDFQVDLDKFEEELSNFQSLDDRKKELIRILDKNQLYYNYANIDDQNVREMLSDEDYQFNKSFYEGGED
ncbi:site-specific DNA-methyltransferase [uncultured Limosilactobacillus sp.]|uniref:site-specific DNA-methyltransferase n=1 Tax=uncultured Limosilactobacillus sp. TaxID=2837629 RepID=UPI0025FEDF87|nr:site-specific DNA-methyltransferase [uncultured Limosilactobacillus sp.]